MHTTHVTAYNRTQTLNDTNLRRDAMKQSQIRLKRSKGGTLRYYTNLPVSFGKDDFMNAILLHEQNSTEPATIKTRAQLAKLAKEYYNYYGTNAIVAEHIDDDEDDPIREKEARAKAKVEELFPELKEEQP